MGKRKRNTQNVVKVDVEEYASRKGAVLPVRVQQSSKDGRRVELAVHDVPQPQQNLPPSTFNPSPAFEDVRDGELPDVVQPNAPERVRSCFTSSGCILMRVSL